MNANVGIVDRALRLIAGGFIVTLGYIGGLEAPWNAVAIAAGSAFMLTALIKFCPLYMIFGINTCTKNAAD
ncbi:hypothetical protein MMIC_P1712 [Mariprofundus micogutta]|uniref:Inner membrane protein YgaP-like transmembrane domain-containing protein n=1 Tax=Mariprofundus micogutta TaxID=1921010 RepID=A0A1L8CPI6_9PROT|nr:DUF2892 domain-containing protein [Mariprofundus micogutta]GAV20739.1 hypothetical protein MMIC_P1712 [Mariprofundus micogutta]